MKHLKQRNIKIVDELMSFCYKQGANKIHIDVITQASETTFMLSAEIPNLAEETLITFQKLLNTPRYHEMEEYYWNLTGDNDTDSELSLIGVMTDESEVKYTDDKILMVKLKRHV